VHNKIDAFNRVPEIILIDECHLISHNGQTQYRRFFEAVRQINPNAKIIGFTGTPFRSDTGRLDEGDEALFGGIAYEIEMSYMIEQGYWAKPVTPELAYKMDKEGVQTRGGDFIAKQLQEKVNTKDVNEKCVKELVQHGQGRSKWLVFTAGVEHCEDVLAEVRGYGIEADMVTGDTPKAERAQIIERFRRGEIKCLVNVAVLTTGFNVPDVDLLCFMRPTRSPVLYIQTTGRGVRPVYADGYDLSTAQGRLSAIAASKKKDCMILDFGGVIDELGPIDQVSIQKSRKEKKETDEEAQGDAPVKFCPECQAACKGAQRYCYECGYQFFKLEDKAAGGAVVSVDQEPEWHEVLDWQMAKHIKISDPDAPASMKVIYSTMGGIFKEYLCFEHHIYGGTNKYYAFEKARQWYKRHIPDIYGDKCPDTVDKAVELEHIYKKPTRILVKPNGKFHNIIDVDFTEKEENKELLDIPFL
jgi:DNA repair protein RadD